MGVSGLLLDARYVECCKDGALAGVVGTVTKVPLQATMPLMVVQGLRCACSDYSMYVGDRLYCSGLWVCCFVV